MGADRHVMGDLDQVIDLGALLDQRLADGGSIDRNISAEFDVILDRDPAELRNLIVSSLILHIAESVASDNRAAVDDDPRADGAAFPDDDVGIEQRIVPDRRIVTYKDTWIDCDSRANRHPVSPGDSRLN